MEPELAFRRKQDERRNRGRTLTNLWTGVTGKTPAMIDVWQRIEPLGLKRTLLKNLILRDIPDRKLSDIGEIARKMFNDLVFSNIVSEPENSWVFEDDNTSFEKLVKRSESDKLLETVIAEFENAGGDSDVVNMLRMIPASVQQKTISELTTMPGYVGTLSPIGQSMKVIIPESIFDAIVGKTPIYQSSNVSSPSVKPKFRKRRIMPLTPPQSESEEFSKTAVTPKQLPIIEIGAAAKPPAAPVKRSYEQVRRLLGQPNLAPKIDKSLTVRRPLIFDKKDVPHHKIFPYIRHRVSTPEPIPIPHDFFDDTYLRYKPLSLGEQRRRNTARMSMNVDRKRMYAAKLSKQLDTLDPDVLHAARSFIAQSVGNAVALDRQLARR
jgi:hypothetical protein